MATLPATVCPARAGSITAAGALTRPPSRRPTAALQLGDALLSALGTPNGLDDPRIGSPATSPCNRSCSSSASRSRVLHSAASRRVAVSSSVVASVRRARPPVSHLLNEGQRERRRVHLRVSRLELTAPRDTFNAWFDRWPANNGPLRHGRVKKRPATL
jgi:hypothetical protein